jgi:hypothetical protein
VKRRLPLLSNARHNPAEKMDYKLYQPIVLGTLFFLLSCSPTELKKTPEFQAIGKTQEETVIKHNPIEDDPRYKTVFEKIDTEVNEALKDHPMRGKFGFVHVFWVTKKAILKNKYGIEWRSPAEMNPHILFD